MMTSRERVLTAFEHKEPDCVPCWCGASVEFWEKAKQELNLGDEELRVRLGDDFRRIFAPYTKPEPELPEGATYQTVFGVARHGIGYGHPMSFPLEDATLKEVEDYEWPDAKWIDASGLRAEAEQYEGKYAILGGDWSPFWHDAIDLVGMENLYYKMVDDPEFVDALFGHIVEYYVESCIRIFDAAADVIDIMFFGNDLGGQNGPLFGLGLFERFVQPHIEHLADVGHSYGIKVMMHCCGGIAPLIPGLIKAGLDGIHAVQPDCFGMDLRTLKADFGDKILFNGAIDSHHILIDGAPESVRQKTREVLELMMPGGGYVAGASHDAILEETPVENVLTMFDTIHEYGIYQ